MSISYAIDQRIEECSGDIHGALKALLLVNERLEAELQYFYHLTELAPRERTTVHQVSAPPATSRRRVAH